MENIILYLELNSNSGIIAAITAFVATMAVIVAIANIMVVYRGNIRLWRVQIRPYLSFEIRYVRGEGQMAGHALCCRNVGKGPAMELSYEITSLALRNIPHDNPYIRSSRIALSEKDNWTVLYFIDESYSISGGIEIRNIRYKNMNEEELMQKDITLYEKSFESPD